MAKGRIIVIDNELFDGMIINRRYVLAHTSNIALKRPFTNPQNNGNLDFLLANLALGGANDGPQPNNGNPYHNPNAQ